MATLLLIVASLHVNANPVDMRNVREVAMKFVNANTKVPLRSAEDLQLVTTYNITRGDAAFHIFNTPNGFVIVAADDCATPILGYSDEGRPFDLNNVPIQLQDIFQEYVEQIGYGIEYHLVADEKTAEQWRQVRETGRLSNNRDNEQVGPLLTTTWDQGQYYNSMCPEDPAGPDGHVYTGCVATAMAQIIRYWEYPVNCRGIHSYDSNYGTLTVNFEESVYDFDNMPDALNTESTTEQVEAVAKLVYDCGVAVNMGYEADESSAFDQEARAAFINFFKYTPNLSFAEKESFTTDEWNMILQTELDANHPVYYSGHGIGGHAFICDGYNTDGYYHFNFGWSGSGNSWYQLDAVNPLNMTFNNNQSAILGIVPDNNSNVILGQMQGNSTFTVDEPMEFYHIMGHNLYEGNDYANPCNSIVNFIPINSTNQMVVDINEFEEQQLIIHDGDGTWIRSLSGGGNNDLSPIVSTTNAISITYLGNLFYYGFKLTISQEDECRMVSNVTSSINATTVNLTWIENGGALEWQIEYGIKGFVLGHGTVETVYTNVATINNLEKFTEYDFYIRPVCDGEQYGPWHKTTLMVEAPYWQDIVTSQPEGYVYNEITNVVEISNAEGLAWWAKNPNNTSVRLIADIDLNDYKWRPIPMPADWIDIDGNGHEIRNLRIIEPSSAAFIEWARYCSIKDIKFINPQVSGTLRTAVIFSHSSTSNSVINTGIEGGRVKGTDIVGTFAGETSSSTFYNCYAKGVVANANRTCGLFAGTGNSDFINCYAHGRAIMHMYCYSSGIIADKRGGIVKRCYSIDMEHGVVGISQGGSCIDTSSFWRNDGIWELRTPIYIDGMIYDNLLDALNNEVVAWGDGDLNTWIVDDDLGLPVFGPKYDVTCPLVSDLTAQNIVENAETKILVSWEDNDVSSWQVKVIESGFSDDAISYLRIVNNPGDTIQGLTLGKTYDIYVRSICDNSTGGWGNPIVLTYDKPYWTEVVSERPEGFINDGNGNVIITSSEGLAWMAKTLGNCNGKTIQLNENIDLSQYRWRPILFNGVLEGNGHTISNIYVNEPDQLGSGLIGRATNAIIRNVNMDGGTVTGRDGVGGLAGIVSNNSLIDNCQSSVEVLTTQQGAGSLCGSVHNSTVLNSSSNGDVIGNQQIGGMIGYMSGGTLKNCFSSSNTYINHSSSVLCWYIGGLVGYFSDSYASNCYSSGCIEIGETSSYVGKAIGCPDYRSKMYYIYAQDSINPEIELIGNYCYEIADTAQFHHDGLSNPLLTTIMIAQNNYTDLLEVLNAWIIWQNDHTMRTWVIESDTGIPVFGDFYEPSCYNPTELSVYNATIIGDTIIRTGLAWTQIGEPDYWEILYVASEHDIVEGVIVPAACNPYVLTGIPVGQPLDFYVRARSGDDSSNWSSLVAYIPDKLRWTEVVTSQPEGYIEDIDGNVYISTAEGLAWLSSVTNGLNGVPFRPNRFLDKNIVLTSDIDLSTYRWTPIGNDLTCCLKGATVMGNNHVISGLYCNELADFQGLIGFMINGTVRDITIRSGLVCGENYVGSIIGYASSVARIDGISFQDNSVDIINCSSEGNILGIYSVGGIVGRHIGNCNVIANTCFRGNVNTRYDITKNNSIPGYKGGICGSCTYDTIFNCYVVSEITNDGAYPGIITCSGATPNLLSNCYYKDYETSISITGNNCNTANNSSFSGNSYSWTLNTPPYFSGEFHTDLVEALNAWVDENNTEGQYLHWVADTAMVNGGFPIHEEPMSPTVQLQSLPSGWTWYTPTVQTSVESIQSSLGNNLELIQAKDGTPSGNVVAGEMYKIQTTAPCTLAVKGVPITSATVTINPGENWFGFVGTTKTVAAAFAGFTPAAGDKVISQDEGFAVYENGAWSGTLVNLQPGKGYVYISNDTEPKTLVIGE